MLVSKVMVLVLISYACASAEVFGDSVNTTTPPQVLVGIQTNLEGARVYLNSDSVGITPLELSLEPGSYSLKLVSPDVESWLAEPVVDSILVKNDGENLFRYSFPQKYLLTSSPTGAEVFSGDSLIGTTPLILKSAIPSLQLRKKGYEDLAVDYANARRGILSGSLKKVWQSNSEDSIFGDAEESSSSLRLYLTGASTILAGAASAYFKVKADNTYSQYVQSRDPAQLSEVNRLDTAAGISLAVTQISLGLFTYFILSE